MDKRHFGRISQTPKKTTPKTLRRNAISKPNVGNLKRIRDVET